MKLTCPAGEGNDELQKAYMPAGSGAVSGSAGPARDSAPFGLGLLRCPKENRLTYLIGNWPFKYCTFTICAIAPSKDRSRRYTWIAYRRRSVRREWRNRRISRAFGFFG